MAQRAVLLRLLRRRLEQAHEMLLDRGWDGRRKLVEVGVGRRRRFAHADWHDGRVDSQGRVALRLLDGPGEVAHRASRLRAILATPKKVCRRDGRVPDCRVAMDCATMS